MIETWLVELIAALPSLVLFTHTLETSRWGYGREGSPFVAVETAVTISTFASDDDTLIHVNSCVTSADEDGRQKAVRDVGTRFRGIPLPRKVLSKCTTRAKGCGTERKVVGRWLCRRVHGQL